MYSKRMQHKWAQQKNIYKNGIDWNKLMYKTTFWAVLSSVTQNM